MSALSTLSNPDLLAALSEAWREFADGESLLDRSVYDAVYAEALARLDRPTVPADAPSPGLYAWQFESLWIAYGGPEAAYGVTIVTIHAPTAGDARAIFDTRHGGFGPLSLSSPSHVRCLGAARGAEPPTRHEQQYPAPAPPKEKPTPPDIVPRVLRRMPPGTRSRVAFVVDHLARYPAHGRLVADLLARPASERESLYTAAGGVTRVGVPDHSDLQALLDALPRCYTYGGEGPNGWGEQCPEIATMRYPTAVLCDFTLKCARHPSTTLENEFGDVAEPTPWAAVVARLVAQGYRSTR